MEIRHGYGTYVGRASLTAARRRPDLPHPHPARGRRGRAGRDPPGA
ncbi:hypothetical protein ACRAWF_33820 [Streptomyces sp. L7]